MEQSNSCHLTCSTILPYYSTNTRTQQQNHEFKKMSLECPCSREVTAHGIYLQRPWFESSKGPLLLHTHFSLLLPSFPFNRSAPDCLTKGKNAQKIIFKRKSFTVSSCRHKLSHVALCPSGQRLVWLVSLCVFRSHLQFKQLLSSSYHHSDFVTAAHSLVDLL